MKISAPIRTSNGTSVQISAEIDGFRQSLWFRFPIALESQVRSQSDSFVVALLLLAMSRSEPLECEGPVSARLLRGLEEYQRIFHSWYPAKFSIVEVRALAREGEKPEARAVATAFSGGVDSFYSLKMLETELSGALFIAGFDMPLNLKSSIGELTDSYSKMMSAKGIPLVVGSTNIREFVNSVDWTNAHGPALAASALFLQGQWSKFHIPSSYRGGAYPKWGSHPRLDHLLSTEEMEFVHHGAEANRVKKLQTLIVAPETYDRLRVCWIQDIGLKNCGECEKCIRTMIALQLLGALRHYRTFATPLTRDKVRGLKMRTHQARLFARELIGEALLRGQLTMAADLGIALLRRGIFRLLRR